MCKQLVHQMYASLVKELHVKHYKFGLHASLHLRKALHVWREQRDYHVSRVSTCLSISQLSAIPWNYVHFLQYNPKTVHASGSQGSCRVLFSAASLMSPGSQSCERMKQHSEQRGASQNERNGLRQAGICLIPGKVESCESKRASLSASQEKYAGLLKPVRISNKRAKPLRSIIHALRRLMFRHCSGPSALQAWELSSRGVAA